MVDTVYWIWLQQLFGIGTARSEQMMEKYASPMELWDALKAKDPMIRLGEREHTNMNRAMEDARRIQQLTFSRGCTIITPDQADYPPLLRHVYAKPAVLYVKGSLACLQEHLPIAIVGTRHYSEYGKEVAEEFSGGLVARGACIVSGLANGIDSISQWAALAEGGYTIGLLACGLDIDYPKGSALLKRATCEHGAVVTEYPIGTPAIPSRFPPRNRIIAGMSRGALVIEAGITSGALITAKHALDAGREVFAVPGSILSGKHLGSHELIRRGEAKLVSCVEDVLVEYPEFQNELQKQERIGAKKPPKEKTLPVGLDAAAEQLYHAIALGDGERTTANQLAGETTLPMEEVLSNLTILEILGLIKSYPGGLFGLL